MWMSWMFERVESECVTTDFVDVWESESECVTTDFVDVVDVCESESECVTIDFVMKLCQHWQSLKICQ